MTEADLSPQAIINRAAKAHPCDAKGTAFASYCMMTLAELQVLQDSLAAEVARREAAEAERDRFKAVADKINRILMDDAMANVVEVPPFRLTED